MQVSNLRANFCGQPKCTLSARSIGEGPKIHGRSSGLRVFMAATKEKKGADLERLTSLLTSDSILVVAGVNYKGLSVSVVVVVYLIFLLTLFHRSKT
jgi:uncharacterized circularly permuted ATP-grasp superfamily protein